MDARDILGIDASAAASAAPRPRSSKPQIKKPEGMSREVFALLVQDAREGRTQIPVVPTADTNFKEKRHRVIGWEWREFTNAGRSDGLTLRHWSKLSDKSTVYHFAKFNKKVKVLDWSDEEYRQHLTHPSWDKEETSALFDLCRRFDLRWPVIHDRFPVGRTMEELKERYYEVSRVLLNARANTAPEQAEHPLAKFKFDAKHELERKAEAERLYDRSAEEVRAETRRLEQAKALESKMKANKKQVKPGGRAAGLAALRASLTANGLGGATGELAVTGLPSLAGIMDAPKKHRANDVWLRSKDLSTKRPASDKLIPAFEQRMQSLRMPVNPLPTEVNVSLYNQCRAHVVLLVELEARIERLEQERQALLHRNQPQQGHSQGGGQKSGGSGAGKKRAIDADQGGSSGGSHKRSHH